MKQTILSVLMASASLALNAQTPSKKDAEFAKKAAEAGLMEVKLGELAMSNASSQDVKTLGQHMVTDHTKANSELMALAATKNISLPSGLSKEGQKHYDMLSKKSGQDFDKAYSKMMVKDHKKVIAKFKAESKKGEDNDLKTWASGTLTTLEHHLQMSKETCDKMKKS